MPWEEQRQILKFLVREVVDAPLSFVFPVRDEVLSIVAAEEEEEVVAER